jgi:hypothetical protein
MEKLLATYDRFFTQDGFIDVCYGNENNQDRYYRLNNGEWVNRNRFSERWDFIEHINFWKDKCNAEEIWYTNIDKE